MSRLTKVFLAYATTSPGCVASHSKDSLRFPNIFGLWRQLQENRKANDGDRFHQGSISVRLDLEMSQVNKGSDGEKGSDWIVDEQAVRYLFCP